MNQPTNLNPQQILQLVSAFRPSCVIGAAAELDVFTRLNRAATTAAEMAKALNCDERGMTTLLDALASLQVLNKVDGYYHLADGAKNLAADMPNTILPMVLHNMTCLRHWADLASVVQSGKPASPSPSIRGAEADFSAFVAAMHVGSGPVADRVVRSIPNLQFTHVLDVGGASGTWTLAFLRAYPHCTATIFDRPQAILQAKERSSREGLQNRIQFASGDFYRDELPSGADFVWVSAIIHQHNRQKNRELFAKAFRALKAGGKIGIRDVVMDETRTSSTMGALFAVNMLVATETGGTFTFREIAEDLAVVGFKSSELAVPASDMIAVIIAVK